MTRLDVMLLPGESVMWRHDPEFSMGPKWPYLMGLAILLVMLSTVGGVVLWNVEVPLRIAILAGLIFLMPVLFCAGPLLSGMWSRAVAVTGQRMVWRSGPAGLGTMATIGRADIAAATVYDGSAVLILHNRDGRTIRLTGVEEAEPMAHALAVPGRIWRRGEEPQVSAGSLWARIAGSLLSIVPLDIIGHWLCAGESGVGDGYGLQVILVIAALLVAATILQIWGEITTARKLSPADRRTRACRRLNPLCRGEEPLRVSPLTVLSLPFIALDRWVVRKAYGGTYNCDCAPKKFGPGAGPGGGPRT